MKSEIKSIVDAMRTRETTAVDEVRQAIVRAKADDHNAILEVIEERALRRAEEIDEGVRKGKIGRLAGVPFIAKDNFLTLGSRTTAASKILEGFCAPIQATAIEKLEAEGAICIGKANHDSFGHGGSTENSSFGVTTNSKDKTRVAGGSSGGSAVAVANGIVPFALGTDTGGSLRQPAAFNGAIGFKPSYGLISRYGVVAMASSTDTVGPIARTVADAELIAEILSGQDGKDMNVMRDGLVPQDNTGGKYTIGIIKEYMAEGVDAQVADKTRELARKLTEAGHTVRDVSVPAAKYALPVYYTVVPAEISSNLARYDGVRYGLRAEGVESLADVYSRSRDAGFVDESKRRILIGAFVLSSGFYDAYYQKAQKVRTILINDFKKAFDAVDFLMGPVAPTVAFKIGKNEGDPLQAYMEDILTVPASLAGLPAIAMPAKVADGELPIGIQVMAPYAKDAELLSFARVVEEVERG